MASLKAIRKRIGSVKNTQKITRAMNLVATARLRRAKESIEAARPYANSISRVVSELSATLGGDTGKLLEKATSEKQKKAFSLLLERKEAKKATVIAMSSDRGLAGGLNANIIRAVEDFADERLADYEVVQLRLSGKKVNGHFSRRDANIASYQPAPTLETSSDVARELATLAIDDFVSGDVDEVFFVYNEFKNAGTQVTVVKQLLPIEAPKLENADNEEGNLSEYKYEPSKEELLSHLLPLYVQTGLLRGCLESVASEFGARMTAMDSATKNAGEMIDKLTLVYNRARQAAITKELLEIIAGAESLKG